MMAPATISDAYRMQCERLHKDRPQWGSYGGGKWAAAVAEIYRAHGCESVLDYGAGKGSLADALALMDIDCECFDPATFPETPTPADLVACLDVLEHIEPEYLDAVLIDLARLTRKVCLAVIATTPAVARLPDGRNAHLIVKPADWWLTKLRDHFDVVNFRASDAMCVVKMTPPMGR